MRVCEDVQMSLTFLDWNSHRRWMAIACFYSASVSTGAVGSSLTIFSGAVKRMCE
jgi:hypothetical protein